MQPDEVPDFLPAYCWVPPSSSSGGPEAVELARANGLDLDPWQAWAVDQVLTEDADGATVAFDAAVIVSRQNGKGAILEALALYWLFLEEVELVLWSAHEFKTASEAFRRLRVLLQGAEDLWPTVAKITTGKGHEEIELVTGQRLKFIARSEASGRGFTGDKIILDEAYDLDPNEMAALVPTMATRPNPQLVYTSSAGLGHSEVLRGVRDRGRPGGDPSLCWLEWCATPSGKNADGDDVYDLDDRAQWHRANPGLGIRITEGFVAKERNNMRAMPELFARERLGVWDKADDPTVPIPLASWEELATMPASSDLSEPTFFIDISPGMRSATIAAAARHRGAPHLELASHQPGAGWLVAKIQDLRRRHPDAQFSADAAGAVPAYLPALRDAGIDVNLLTAREMGQACSHFENGVKDGGFTHSGDPLFVIALAGAARRDIGDGQWAWGRRKSTTDISPLVAVTGALWVLAEMGADYDLADSFG